MIVKKLGLTNFRNIQQAFVELSPGINFLIGLNGQGKTNFLEALSLITALRPFRGHQTAELIRHQQAEASLFFEIDHEALHHPEVSIELRKQSKQLSINNQKVTRLADFIGQFPVVVMTADDISLLRGSPSERRRFIDLTLSVTDLTYLRSLQSYCRALEHRNHLLRQGETLATLFQPFETILAQAAVILIEKRRIALNALHQALQRTYAFLAGTEEGPEIVYQPNITFEMPALLEQHYSNARQRDRLLKATQHGPHRDDFIFKLNQTEAPAFASEGQQRALVLSLKYAQLKYFQAALQVTPVLLADDILGQLDCQRSERFWHAIMGTHQVLFTGTALPQLYETLSSPKAVFEVKGGAMRTSLKPTAPKGQGPFGIPLW